MATSRGQNQVFQSFFARLDVDQNGIINADDFHKRAEKMAQDHAINPDSDEYKKLMDESEAMWKNIAGFADVNHDGQITEDEWHKSFTKLILDPTNFQKFMKNYVQGMTAAISTDGKLSKENVVSWITSVGQSSERATTFFQRLDTDNDGFVTVDQMVELIHSMIIGEDSK